MPAITVRVKVGRDSGNAGYRQRGVKSLTGKDTKEEYFFLTDNCVVGLSITKIYYSLTI